MSDRNTRNGDLWVLNGGWGYMVFLVPLFDT